MSTLFTLILVSASLPAFADSDKPVSARQACEAEAIKYWQDSLRGAYGNVKPAASPVKVFSNHFEKTKTIILVGSAEVKHEVRKYSMVFKQWGSALLRNQCYFSQIEKKLAPQKSPTVYGGELAMLSEGDLK